MNAICNLSFAAFSFSIYEFIQSTTYIDETMPINDVFRKKTQEEQLDNTYPYLKHDDCNIMISKKDRYIANIAGCSHECNEGSDFCQTKSPVENTASNSLSDDFIFTPRLPYKASYADSLTKNNEQKGISHANQKSIMGSVSEKDDFTERKRLTQHLKRSRDINQTSGPRSDMLKIFKIGYYEEAWADSMSESDGTLTKNATPQDNKNPLKKPIDFTLQRELVSHSQHENMKNRDILHKFDKYAMLEFQTIFCTKYRISAFTNIFNHILSKVLDLTCLKRQLSDPFRTSRNLGDLVYFIKEKLARKYGENSEKIILKTTGDFFGKIGLLTKNRINKLAHLKCNSLLIEGVFLQHQEIYKIIKIINWEAKNLKIKNACCSRYFDEIMALYISLAIDSFFTISTNCCLVNKVFPEIKILYALYKDKINYHTITNCRVYAGDFIVYNTIERIGKLKAYFYSSNFRHDRLFAAKILEIRILYLLEFFKLLNIKKAYLLMYVLKSINSFYLQCDYKCDYLTEINDFYKIFNNSVSGNIAALHYNLNNNLNLKIFIF